MKEQVLDVLLYLFENYMYDDPDEDSDRDSLQAQLLEAGFTSQKIKQAFEWLDELEDLRPCRRLEDRSDRSVRVYAPEEMARLDVDCRGFMLFLEDAGVLDEAQRELVLDRVMALEADEVDLDDLKWVVLMVLFNQPGQEEAFAWMENLMFESDGEALH